jgi:hypothetical protein
MKNKLQVLMGKEKKSSFKALATIFCFCFVSSSSSSSSERYIYLYIIGSEMCVSFLVLVLSGFSYLGHLKTSTFF